MDTPIVLPYFGNYYVTGLYTFDNGILIPTDNTTVSLVHQERTYETAREIEVYSDINRSNPRTLPAGTTVTGYSLTQIDDTIFLITDDGDYIDITPLDPATEPIFAGIPD